MDQALYDTVIDSARGLWPKSDDGLPEASISMAQLVQVLKSSMAAALSAADDKVPNALVKDLFSLAVKGAAGRPSFVKVKKVLGQKSQFSLAAAI
jgi:hypothetical protein